MLSIVGSAKVKRFLGKRLQRIPFRDSDFTVKSSDIGSASLTSDGRKLTLCAPDLGMLDNVHGQIGLLQYFYRFAALNSLNTGYFLMHGSASIINGKGVVFGDDGSSIGKTTSMIETALLSGNKKYIGDEFIFWDSKRNTIFSDDNILMHIRGLAKKHFKNKHNIFVKEDFVMPGDLGLRRVKEHPLHMLAYVNFNKGEGRVRVLSADAARKASYMTLSAHLLKFFNPSLDRFNFISQKDTSLRVNLARKAKKFGKFSHIEPILRKAAIKLASKAKHVVIRANSSCAIPRDIIEVIKNEANRS